ncbi:hypothetical protein MAR_008203 [Mya arenaria]|uniref:NACHT domain-containing protein n=1 Tax=Mya arenaria TaxID=6604 RepID=A0ABY7DYB7_MYAAR|nr:hypothetical protein MAR_008203 [Mya arenaria]
MVLQFGAFSRFQPGTTLRFACGISMDFLAARHIADMPYEDIDTVVMKNKMFKFAKYSQVLQSLCDQLAARDEYCIRGFYLPAPTLESPASMTSEQRPKVPRGVLEDFVTSLQCLSELIIRPERMIALKTLQGLSLCMDHPECTIQELELVLHQYHHFQLPVFLQLAASTGKCRNIRSIKFTWSSLDLMAKYLEGVMASCDHIETLYITEDLKVKFNHPVSAATWAALPSAFSNTTSLQKFAFVNCHVTAVVNHVLQHIPTSIEQINFTGCAFNVMCVGQWRYFKECKCVKAYDTCASGELDLTGHALSPLQKSLDLSDCELNTEMCTRLLLLDKISESKLAYSLKALFDAMKLKYKKLHDHCIEVRKQTQKISSTEFLPPPWKDGKGNRIVLEGESGSGKSLLCSWLAYMWATTPNYFRNTYQHVLLLNMAELEGNFETAVYRSLFPDNFKISVNEFWNMLERNAQNVLLVIDDYDRECE